MHVYRLTPEEGPWQFLVPSGPAAGERLADLPSRHFHPSEPTIPVDLVRMDPRDGALQPVDLPWLTSNVPAFTLRAAEQLTSLLEASGSFFPLDTLYGDFVAFDTYVCLPALDLQASEVARFRSGRIMDIERHVFHPEVVNDEPIFLLDVMDRAGSAYVTTRYVEAVHELGLRGIAFEKLWATDD